VNREEKQQAIDHFHQEIAGARSAYLVEFAGLTVAQFMDLRRKTRDASGRCRVVKNRLAQRSVAGTALADEAPRFKGPTAVAWTEDDPVALGKVLAEFQKNTPLKVKGLVIEGRSMEAATLERITSLPTRPELIATFAGMLKSPIQKFALLLKAPVRDLASVLRQVAEKKGS
jgi:large subunit ribosomal protein L10